MDKDEVYGVALSGGAVLGAAHIGVLKAIEENSIKVGTVAGTSIGAIVAALYAFGKNVDDIEKIAEGINFKSLFSISPTKLGLFSNIKISNFIQEHLGKVNIEDAPIPLKIIATDISTLQKVVLDRGDLVLALMASCAIPGIFSPVEVGSELLVDGGLVENAPLKTLKELGMQRTITVCLASKHISKRPKNLIEVILNSHSCMLQMLHKEFCGKDDILIEPDLKKYSVLKTNEMQNIMKIGYEEAKRVLVNFEEKGPVDYSGIC